MSSDRSRRKLPINDHALPASELYKSTREFWADLRKQEEYVLKRAAQRGGEGSTASQIPEVSDDPKVHDALSLLASENKSLWDRMVEHATKVGSEPESKSGEACSK